MDIKFADNASADVQDRACSILASLSLMVDARMHMQQFSKGTNTYWVYWHEMEHHYKWAVFNTLRLLGILTQSNIDNRENVDRICDMGHVAFKDIIGEYTECFDTDVE